MRSGKGEETDLCAPQSENDHAPRTVAHLLGEEVRVGIVNGAPIDADDEVKPWLDGEVSVGVAQDLEAAAAVAGAG